MMADSLAALGFLAPLIQNLWLVPLYPLVAFLIIALGRALPAPINAEGEPSVLGAPWLAQKEAAMGLTVGATALGLLHAIAAVIWLFSQHGGHVHALEQNWQWLSVGKLHFSLGTLLDAPSVMMLFVVTFVSLLIQIYTHGYMAHDKGYAKFFGYLALFNFSMLSLVLSSNLFQIYIFWELVGLSSYLLIGFWFQKPSAAAAAIKAFLVNRLGDLGLLLGILTLLFVSYPWWQAYLAENPHQALLSFTAFEPLAESLKAGLDPTLLALIPILLFFGPMAKSAQAPLHTWLPDAMEGPTPISALIHAATMVAAGVFLVARLYPLFEASAVAMQLVTWVGLSTAVIGATIALVQTDIKKALAYSTMSQLGFMVTAMGVGAYTAGLFHLFTHAFFKAMLFLCSGSVIHACEDEQDMRQMGGLWSKLPVTAWTYLIGTIAISGLAWTSGFWSKDEILLGAQAANPYVFYTLVITAGLTSFYMFRTFFLTFTGTYRGSAHVHHEDPVMTTPLAILAVPSLLIGGGLALSFGQYLVAPGHHPHLAEALEFFTPVGITSQVVGLTGLLAATALYSPKAIFSASWFEEKFPSYHTLFVNKWFFDDIYKGLMDGGYLAFARFSSVFDRVVIDGAVHGSAKLVQSSGAALRVLQSGRVQTYVALLGTAVVLLTLYLWRV